MKIGVFICTVTYRKESVMVCGTGLETAHVCRECFIFSFKEFWCDMEC